jgi:hypothetical protein
LAFNLATTPFSSTSSWNTPVNSNATYTPLNWPAPAGIQNGIAYNYMASWDAYSPSVYVASSTDPVVQVSVPGGWGYPAGTVSVHMPTAANGAAGTDGELLVVDGDTVYNFWQFNRTSATTATAVSYGEANVTTGTGWGTQSPFLSAGITAAGSSELGGLLVQAETDTGTINHALQLVLDGSLAQPGFTGNAISGDGGSSSGIAQEGEHLAIAPGTPMPSGLSTLGQEVFRALQQYGAYVVDVAGGDTAIRTQANAYSDATITALDQDLKTLMPLMDAVTGGTPSSTPPSSTSSGTPSGTPVTTPVSGTSSGSSSSSGAGSTTGSSGGSSSSGAGSTTGHSGSTSLTGTGSTTGSSGGSSSSGVGSTTGHSGSTSSGGAGTTTGSSSSDPTTPASTGSSSSTTTSTTAPALTVDNASLQVNPNTSAALGLGVNVPNSKDSVTVNISGLPRYETITDNLDHRTFRGSSINLTADQVNSGLTLTSHYRGVGSPTATLTVTAHDSAEATIAPKTITVQDPPATTTTTGSVTSTPTTGSGTSLTATGSGTPTTTTGSDTSTTATGSGTPTTTTGSDTSTNTTGSGTPTTTTGSGTSTTTSGSGTSSGHHHHHHHHHHHNAVTASSSGTSTTTSDSSSGQSGTSQNNVAQWFSDHPDFARAATTLSDAGASKWGATNNGATTSTDATGSAGARAYALLNQMMAGDFGGHSQFASTATASSASSQQQANLLATPLH